MPKPRIAVSLHLRLNSKGVIEVIHENIATNKTVEEVEQMYAALGVEQMNEKSDEKIVQIIGLSVALIARLVEADGSSESHVICPVAGLTAGGRVVPLALCGCNGGGQFEILHDEHPDTFDCYLPFGRGDVSDPEIRCIY